ncbi:hypothetical protein V6N12_045371 [Hibiscus sabdariffa]|uniref:RNase H type-1 domain-containing protein n=1 Tax=Hibiscus sabdariffa TaxID=183260 RepID=A0ABR2G333_9ROSI
MAVIHGMQFAKDLSFSSIIVESDSRTEFLTHAMATIGLRATVDRFWIEESPEQILLLAAEDHRFSDPP